MRLDGAPLSRPSTFAALAGGSRCLRLKNCVFVSVKVRCLWRLWGMGARDQLSLVEAPRRSPIHHPILVPLTFLSTPKDLHKVLQNNFGKTCFIPPSSWRGNINRVYETSRNYLPNVLVTERYSKLDLERNRSDVTTPRSLQWLYLSSQRVAAAEYNQQRAQSLIV